ncbi:MAG TPA: MFS transporter [Anaerolineaceae bacterium]|nr:MFS transporter [Anaerolineaceae bacterium]
METTLNSSGVKSRNPMAAVLGSRNFRLLWIGQGLSLLGDQFYLITMPWLVLRLTGGDALALGTVLALAGLPRAIFMLLGGAVTDRFSPRTVMLACDAVRLVLIAGLAALVMAQGIQIWMLYAFSLLFGIAAGFFMPASYAIVPRLVGKENLQGGSAITQGTAQIAQFLGPALAGGLLAWAGRDLPTGVEGAGLAFAFDALTFLVSIATLWRINLTSIPEERSADRGEKVLASIWSGLRHFWGDSFIRFVLVMMACGSLFIVGILMVGVPVLASSRLGGGAGTYGLLISVYAGGSLLGVAGAGMLPRPGVQGMKWLLTVLNLVTSLAWIALAEIHSPGLAAVVMFFVGLGSGYQGIVFFTAMQKRVPGQLMGRLMSLVLLFNVGLAPISQTLAGLVIRWSLPGLFRLAGVGFLALVTWACFQPEMKMVGEILAKNSEMQKKAVGAGMDVL